MRNPNDINKNQELVNRFLLHMDSCSCTQNSQRLKAALLYLLELDVPEDHRVKELYAEVADRTDGDWRAVERSSDMPSKGCGNFIRKNVVCCFITAFTTPFVHVFLNS